MVETDSRPEPRTYLHSLRRHVLDPISTAIGIVDREQTEVTLERDAFERFADRTRSLPSKPPRTGTVPTVSIPLQSSTTDTAALRRAYSETVMNVPHYEDAYDESVTENVTAEFGPEIATLFDPGAVTSVTEATRERVVMAASQAAADRDEFCGTLDSELESLRVARRELSTVLDELDSSVIPAWYRQEFEGRLSEIIECRQSEIDGRSISYFDGHNLCTYLYGDEPRTYPALTAVARLLDSVTVREGG